MEGLKALLDNLADEARPYNVVVRAEKAVRRRRRLSHLTPVVAAVVVSLVVGAGWVTLHRPSSERVAGPGVSDVSWLPVQLTAAKANPPALPTDHGIGPAALLYSLGNRDQTLMEDPGWRVVTPDGKQYWIGPTSRGNPQNPLGLSPDGRWLVLARGDTAVLRDLTGTSERTVADKGATRALWSPDGKQLVLIHRIADDDVDSSVTVVDVSSGARSTASLAALPEARPIGVDSTGDLVLRAKNPGGVSVKLWFVDPATGHQQRQLTVDLSSSLRGKDEPPAEQSDPVAMDAKFLLDGTSMLVRTYRTLTVGGSTSVMPDDLLVVDLNTGKVAKRHKLPDPSSRELVKPDGPSSIGGQAGEWRDMLAASPDGVLFVALGPDPVLHFSGPTALELLTPTTGKRTVVTPITGDIHRIKLRGQP